MSNDHRELSNESAEELHENEHWTEVFQHEMESGSDDYSTPWWEDCYAQLATAVDNCLSSLKSGSVLEAGCGSGKATLLLKTPFNRIVLLDFSEAALRHARHLAEQYYKKNVKTVHGNIFALPFADAEFEFTWNTGVLEHYEPDKIIEMLAEMMRVTKDQGWIGFGIPNKRSLPILKARILGHAFFGKMLRSVRGYRLDSEKFYSNTALESYVRTAASRAGVSIRSVSLHWIGNPLLVGIPAWLVRITNPIGDYMPKQKFLVLFMVNIIREA
jgi:ubiquinone/menaquinone biosynthesis C-methylase UbiE